MPWAASAFQQVLSVVQQWWLRSFDHVLVGGQHALTYDDGRKAQPQYAYTLLSRLPPFSVQAEDQGRGRPPRRCILRSHGAVQMFGHICDAETVNISRRRRAMWVVTAL